MSILPAASAADVYYFKSCTFIVTPDLSSFHLVDDALAQTLKTTYPDVLTITGIVTPLNQGDWFGNIKGTTADNREPSWIKFWERSTGITRETCCVNGCPNPNLG